MMRQEEDVAIVLLGHGSRVQGAGRQMEEVSEALSRRHGFPVVATCYMSRLGPHLPEVLETVVRGGARKVIVVPYFLHGGLHILLDIPELLQEQARKYANVTIILGRNLGFDESLVDLVYKRIQESMVLTDIRHVALPPRERFPVPDGQCEFVPMMPEEAKRFRHTERDDHWLRTPDGTKT